MDIVQLLVKHGASTTLENGFGSTPSQQARNRHHPEVAAWLAEAQAKEEAAQKIKNMPTWGEPKEEAKEEL